MHSPTNMLLLAISVLGLGFASALDEANMVPREFMNSDGVVSTIYVNENLHFTRTPVEPPTSRIIKRVAFTGSSNTDYCSETNPVFDFSASAPLKSDCDQVASYMETQSGFYTIQASEFTGNWVRIYTRGTCSFAVRPLGTAEKLQIGTNDIRFYIVTYSGQAQNGKIKAEGAISCYNGQKIVFVSWGMIHS